jgi:O-antigen/teichoic acid export membrane protein
MKNLLLKNTVTNYLTVIVRSLQGILVTRWMIAYLGTDNYGLWALLWAFFAYALLLDFGFGLTAMKYTSSGLYRQDIRKYNSIISAVFSFHALGGLLIASGGVLAAIWAGELFNISDPQRIAYCRLCLLLFAGGAAVAFPSGVFPEILIGLQKLYLRNYVTSITKLVELCATFVILVLGGQVIPLIILSIILWLGANLSMAALIVRQIKGFRLYLKIDPKDFREIFSFSGFIYLNAVSTLLMEKSSYMVISILSGLPSVGLYQAAGRLGDYCMLGCSQYQENVRPTTASLYAHGEFGALKKFILQSMRYNCYFALFFILPAFLYAEEALAVLFKISDPEVIYFSRLFLILAFVKVTGRQVMHSYLIMVNKHKFVGLSAIGEALVFLVLSVILFRPFGIQGILWSGIGLRLGVSFLLLAPTALGALHLSPFKWGWQVLILPLLAAAPCALLGLAFRYYFASALGSFLTVALGAALTSGVFAVLVFFLLFSRYEREKAYRMLRPGPKEPSGDNASPPPAMLREETHTDLDLL